MTTDYERGYADGYKGIHEAYAYESEDYKDGYVDGDLAACMEY